MLKINCVVSFWTRDLRDLSNFLNSLDQQMMWSLSRSRWWSYSSVSQSNPLDLMQFMIIGRWYSIDLERSTSRVTYLRPPFPEMASNFKSSWMLLMLLLSSFLRNCQTVFYRGGCGLEGTYTFTSGGLFGPKDCLPFPIFNCYGMVSTFTSTLWCTPLIPFISLLGDSCCWDCFLCASYLASTRQFLTDPSLFCQKRAILMVELMLPSINLWNFQFLSLEKLTSTPLMTSRSKVYCWMALLSGPFSFFSTISSRSFFVQSQMKQSLPPNWHSMMGRLSLGKMMQSSFLVAVRFQILDVGAIFLLGLALQQKTTCLISKLHSRSYSASSLSTRASQSSARFVVAWTSSQISSSNSQKLMGWTITLGILYLFRDSFISQ